MTEGVEAPGPPETHYEPAASVDTGADASAGRPGYVSDEAHEPASGPSHGERKKGEHAPAPAPPERTQRPGKSARPQKGAARCIGPAAHGPASRRLAVSVDSPSELGLPKRDIRSSRLPAEGSAQIWFTGEAGNGAQGLCVVRRRALDRGRAPAVPARIAEARQGGLLVRGHF